MATQNHTRISTILTDVTEKRSKNFQSVSFALSAESAEPADKMAFGADLAGG